jgi:hypothetical protein
MGLPNWQPQTFESIKMITCPMEKLFVSAITIFQDRVRIIG